MSIHFCYKWRSTDYLNLKMIIQWIHLYNSCDDDLLSVTGLEGKQLTDGLRQNQK